jgi:hypothetical protein
VAGHAPEPTVVVAARARTVRCAVGLTAWAALEELLLDAAPHPSGSLHAQASARVLATRLGVSKDTAAGALRRLASLGLVRREDHRDPTRGVFARSVYVIDGARLDQRGIRLHTAPPTKRARRGGTSVAARDGDRQASLFDLSAEEQ